MALPGPSTTAHAPSPTSAPIKYGHEQATLPPTSATNSVPTNAGSVRAIPLIPPSLQPPSALIDATTYRIPPPLPDAAYYIPSFITPREEAAIVAAINAAPVRRWVHLARRRLQVYPCPVTDKGTLVVGSAKDLQLPEWMNGVLERLSRVRLPGGSGAFAGEENALGAEREGGSGRGKQGDGCAGEATAARRPNYCLVNEYRPGQGINMHEDGPAYIPVVATVTLGSYGVLDIVRKDRQYATSAAATMDGNEHSGAEAASVKPVTNPDPDGRVSPPWRVLQERRSLLISTADVYTQCLHGIEAADRDVDLFGPETDNTKCVVNAELLGVGRAGSGERGSGGSAAEEEDEGEDDIFEAGVGVRGTRLSLTFRFVRKVRTVGRALGQRVGGSGAGR